MIFTRDLKDDLIIFEPHYVKFLFIINLLHTPAVWVFDIWKIIGNSLKYFFDLLDVFSE